jgi:two-component system, cell cycle response regulator
MRVLVAEDDYTSRAMLSAVLRKGGYEVIEAADGTQAWDILRAADAPKLVILDWMMPGMDGLEVIRRVRGIETAQPPYIIMLTAKGDSADIVSGLEAGADDYVAKPFDSAELHARLKVAERVIRLQARLATEACIDAMTGLPNRASILRSLKRELSRVARVGGGVAVGLFDIDHFKRVNDTFGHAAGDDVLREFGARCTAAMRSYDTLGRYGGEEFLMVAPMRETSAKLWERARASVAATPFKTNRSPVRVTVSIGIAFGRSGNDIDALIASADAALYRAKENGRNQIAFAEPIAEVLHHSAA